MTSNERRSSALDFFKTRIRGVVPIGIFSTSVFFVAPSPAAQGFPGLGAFRRFLDRFEFMPEQHMTADVIYLTNYKNSDYKHRYFIETNSDMEFILASYREVLYSDWFLFVRTGMGRQQGVVIFDPRDVRYGITPSLELRLRPCNVRASLDHFCFHDIDTSDNVTESWNKISLAVSSKNYRLAEYRRGLIGEDRWDLASRCSWMARMGNYLDNAYGIPMGGGQDYRWEGTCEGRYAFARRLDWLLDLRAFSNWNVNRNHRLMQTYVLGVESHFRRGSGGSLFFVNYNVLDELEVRPKDRIVELGIRFYN